jgi:formylglycine-generating enzyme required for sulfatase activity
MRHGLAAFAGLLLLVLPLAPVLSGDNQRRKEVTNSVGMRFIYCPPGTFLMGSPPAEKDRRQDEVPHQVTLTKAFYLGQTTVTHAQWQAVMGKNPSAFKGPEDLPVEQVSWDDCQEFCRKLSAKDGKPYRLPTEAEWEYACRAGEKTAYFYGDEPGLLGEFAWYERNASNRTQSVATKGPNTWGLYDMHGNVWQWCQDWYGYYPNTAVTDPQGPKTGKDRVFRGGAWGNDARGCRCAARYWGAPGGRRTQFGVRVAFSAD